MTDDVEFWRLAAGLGLFLFGMFQLEHALQQLAGRSFKKFLRKHTANPLKGVLSGAFATATLQSSSVVGLIVLALAGAGVIELANALGIIFGANLGTTFTGWIVATVGFKMDIEALALPLIAVGGLGVVWSPENSRRAGFSYLIAGFGLMLLGLEFMKSGALSAADLFDPTRLAGLPLIVFLLVGIAVTVVIQSSSATIMITLSALYAGVIDLPSAAALAIGADFGTTGTILLGTLTGSPVKKQIAAGLLTFNVFSDVVGFLFLHQFLALITNVFGVDDPLFTLVTFHTLINLVGVLVFLPITRPLSRFLQKRYAASDGSLVRYLGRKEEAIPDVAVDNISKETLRLIDQACALNQLAMDERELKSFYDSELDRRDVDLFMKDPHFDQCYGQLKKLEGAILAYVLQLQKAKLEEEESVRLGELIPAIRNAVHSAKYSKDVRADMQAFRQSPNDTINAYYGRFKGVVRSFYAQLYTLRDSVTDALIFESLVELKSTAERLHDEMHASIFADLRSGALSAEKTSTLLNVNREIMLSNHGLITALAESSLPAAQAENFANLPPMD